MDTIKIRNMTEKDCAIISEAFMEQGWRKFKSIYEYYYEEQNKGNRDILIAEYDHVFAGYVTIVWNSTYPLFKENAIPEIKDFNVLIKYRRKHIGTALMDEAEKRIRTRSKLAGLLVGLLSDYGAAQALYIKRGYVPDGEGISYNYKQLSYGDKTIADDDLALGLIKDLEK